MRTPRSLLTSFLLLLPISTLSLIDVPTENTVARNSYVDPSLILDTEFIPLSQITDDAAGISMDGITNPNDGIVGNYESVKVDVKSGRITKVDLNAPLFPGDNRLLSRVTTDTIDNADDRSNLNSYSNEAEITKLVTSGLQQYISQSNILSINPDELFSPNSVRTAVHDNGYGSLIQVNMQRSYRGVPFRDSRAFGTVKNGNLIMFGLDKWGDVSLDVNPKLTVGESKRILAEFAEEDLIEEDVEQEDDADERFDPDERLEEKERTMELLDLCTPELQILILDAKVLDEENTQEGSSGTPRRYLKTKSNKHNYKKKHPKKDTKAKAPTFEIGSGYTHALIWRICPRLSNQNQEIMEGLVDAHTGRIYSFIDTIDYFSGVGSVYPVSNDGQVPDGILQSGYPMPFMEIKGDNGDAVISDTGGNYWSTGNKTVRLSGQYVHVSDLCGDSSLNIEGDFDWGGLVNGTDCDTPDFGGEGNTQASRSGYYELNRIIEIARSHLPGNGWLKKRLTANMNIVSSCNAYWDGSTVNFYRSSGEFTWIWAVSCRFYY